MRSAPGTGLFVSQTRPRGVENQAAAGREGLVELGDLLGLGERGGDELPGGQAPGHGDELRAVFLGERPAEDVLGEGRGQARGEEDERQRKDFHSTSSYLRRENHG
jgi:hypothetical protein